jgi:hypothetical protein
MTGEAAFEVLSVRESSGTRQPLRTEGKELVDFSDESVRKEMRAPLKRIRAPDGNRVRANVERLGRELGKAWKQGGKARGELHRFVHKFSGTPEERDFAAAIFQYPRQT